MKRACLILPLFIILTAVPVGVFAETGSLVSMLTGSLGVTDDQATSGAGAIFALAKERLSSENFETATSAIPDMSTLLEAAPKLTGAIGAASDLAALATKGEDSGGLTSLVGAFTQLGMSKDTMLKFIPIVLKYANTSGGETAMKLLEGVLK